MPVHQYEIEFQNALGRTASWGLQVPNFEPNSKILMDKSGLKSLQILLQNVMGEIPEEGVSQQCFAITYLMKEKLEELFKTELTYTLGYVELERRPVFYTPEKQLKSLIDKPLLNRSFNLHAWLTTPSYEIIDLTFGTTYGVVNNKPEAIGGIAAQHCSLFTDGFIHHPQLIGEDYLSAIGAIVQVGW